MHGLRVQLQIGLVNRKGKMMFDIGLDLQKAFDEGYEKGKADRPQGEWIIEIDANGYTYGRCSICGMKQYAGQLNFCPDCGAKMKGVDNETETQISNLEF